MPSDLIRRMDSIGDPKGADDLGGLVGSFKAEPVSSEQKMTCSTQLDTSTTCRCTFVLNQSDGLTDSHR
jgi:hypothetical protein